MAVPGVRCTQCGSDTDASSRFCPTCGKSLEAGSSTSVETLALPDPPTFPQPPLERAASTPSHISSSAMADEGRFLPGTLIGGRYRIITLIGRGGMGEVYRATDLTLAQSVALKFLPEAAARNQSLLERFHNEVRVARQVSHPNVCRVYDIGQVDGLPYLSMEYLDGEDLATTLSRIGRLPPDKALEIARKICAGLNAAHAKGVIHRDLKPSNIMLDRRGEVQLMDFGLAAVAESVRGLEARQGTPAYMSPEQLRGSEVTSRSDIYALGLIFYELFTGKKAFEAKSIAELIQMQESVRPIDMSSHAEGIDPLVEPVILRCLHPDPTQRPPTAVSVSAALPGGDPLAAALAAGETPSPELVAAADAGGLTGKRAAVCFAAVMAGIAILPFVNSLDSVPVLTPMAYPPVVLEEKAREIARELGYASRPADWSSTMRYNDPLLRFLQHRDGAKDWRALFEAENPVQLRYRQSPRLLETSPDGAVRDNRPPHDITGMLRLTVDSSGRLREFSAVPPQMEETPGDAAPADPVSVFRALGFPLESFSASTPRYTPETAFDTRQAWTGAHPGLEGVKVTVEVASWRGKVTDVSLIWPWTRPGRMTEEATSSQERWGQGLSLLMLAIGVGAAVLLARRNLRAGRGDRPGALRVAAAMFALGLLSWLFTMHFVLSFALTTYAIYHFGSSLAGAALVWLIYMAMEPFVRARWPHALIAWSRILAGNFFDRRVGSDILIGMLAGVLFLVGLELQNALIATKGSAPAELGLVDLSGTRSVIGNFLDVLKSAITSSFLITLLLFGVKRLVRRDRIAAVATAAVFAGLQALQRGSDYAWIEFAFLFVIYGGLTFALMRFGLVTGIAAIVTINVAGQIILSTDFTAWYEATGFLKVLLLAGLACVAYRASQRRRATVEV